MLKWNFKQREIKKIIKIMKIYRTVTISDFNKYMEIREQAKIINIFIPEITSQKITVMFLSLLSRSTQIEWSLKIYVKPVCVCRMLKIRNVIEGFKQAEMMNHLKDVNSL